MLVVYSIVLAVSFLYFSNPNRVTRHRLLFFICLSMSLGAFTIVYADIENSYYLNDINEFLIKYTDRTATSGRQFLWPTIIDSIIKYPIFGIGAGALPSDIMYTELSSHNYYLQVALQTGFLGLLFSIFSIYVIWSRLVLHAYVDAKGAFATSVLLVFILHNVSEVIMFQNGLRVSVAAWVLLFISFSSTLNANLSKVGRQRTGIRSSHQ
ncbi:O-antigen ligase family protein [Hydrogenophaga taeniospiralis]|uniref:O-antigen ligase family protein n=1 Tax=Hydrogenophaga taeniospiralis TaxID=65656 RepID=UPI0039AFA8A9|nr:O-antigen ligase family protein [Hydrogenophaga taeniospiralis]